MDSILAIIFYYTFTGIAFESYCRNDPNETYHVSRYILFIFRTTLSTPIAQLSNTRNIIATSVFYYRNGEFLSETSYFFRFIQSRFVLTQNRHDILSFVTQSSIDL